MSPTSCQLLYPASTLIKYNKSFVESRLHTAFVKHCATNNPPERRPRPHSSIYPNAWCSVPGIEQEYRNDEADEGVERRLLRRLGFAASFSLFAPSRCAIMALPSPQRARNAERSRCRYSAAARYDAAVEGRGGIQLRIDRLSRRRDAADAGACFALTTGRVPC
jgi:hypothetical protein